MPTLRCCELGRLTFPKSYSSLINLVLSAFVNLTASRRWEERESFDMGGTAVAAAVVVVCQQKPKDLGEEVGNLVGVKRTEVGPR